jgi:signal transduction histidine kinase
MPELSEAQLFSYIARLASGKKQEIHLQTLHQKRDGTHFKADLRLSLLQLPSVSALIAVRSTPRREPLAVQRALPDAQLTSLLLQIRQARSLLAELMHQFETMQRIASQLRPIELDAGLVSALELLAQELREQAGLSVNLRCKQTQRELDPAIVSAVWKVAQEACNNVRQHAQADQVDIVLYDSGSTLELEVIDNGRGMNPSQRDSPESLGMQAMQEGVSMLGGSLSIASAPGKGTIVRLKLPLAENHSTLG